LRAGFEATMRDPGFLADARKVGLDIAPMPGGKLQQVVEKLYGASTSLIERARQAIH
jgi:hypothetical protein